MINNVEVEIIKGIKLDKKNEKIFIRSSPSNEYPKKYKRHEYFSNCNNFIEKQLSFFCGIMCGMYNLKICDNVNWKYAEIKLREFCVENNINISELCLNAYNDKKYDDIINYYNKFSGYVKEKHKGRYVLTCKYGYIYKITHLSFFYTQSDNMLSDCLFDYKTAYIKMKNFGDDFIENHGIGLKKYMKSYSMDDIMISSNRKREYDFSEPSIKI